MQRLLSILVFPTVLGGTSAAPYRVRLVQPDGTDLFFRATVEAQGAGDWTLYSRPGAAAEMVPWYKALAGRLFRKLPPHAALIAVRDGTAAASGDSLLLQGTLTGPMLGTLRLRGAIRNGRINATLRGAVDTTFDGGRIEGEIDTTRAALRDYPAIAREMQRVTSALVYDARLPHTDHYQSFFRDLQRAFGDVRDDLDAVAKFYALVPRLRTTHFNLIRNPKLASTPLDSIIAGDPSVDPRSLVRLDLGTRELAYLYVRRWDRVGPIIDRAFERIDSAGVRVLIIDIRGNGGGDATSMVPATHLLRDTTRVGAFVGRKWYATHTDPPTPSQFASFPAMRNTQDAKHLLDLVYDPGGAQGIVAPSLPIFGGTVFVLTDRRTGSASEPFAYVMKVTRRATLIGERTAGAMLTALPHPVGGGFIMTVPEADYYAADGTRLEQRGVDPDVATSSPDALVAVGERVKSILPYAGNVWLARAYTTLRRYDDAERAWHEAMPLAANEAERTMIKARLDALAKLPR